MYNKVLGYNLLIRPKVQLYLYSGVRTSFELLTQNVNGPRPKKP